MLIVKSLNKDGAKEIKLCERKVNLAEYIGQGMVRDKIRNLGNQVIELEIDVQVRAVNDEDNMDFAEEEGLARSKSGIVGPNYSGEVKRLSSEEEEKNNSLSSQDLIE